MTITVKPHAEVRMKDRRITMNQLSEVLRNPRETVSAKFGRFAAYGEVKGKKLAVIYEKKNQDIEVITVLWVDERRLKRLGFSGI